MIVVAVPLTDETRRLLDADLLRRLPDGALVVNVARGGVVDTEALTAEVTRGRLFAALDVTDPEPLPKGHALWKFENVIITPHIAGRSDRDAERMTGTIKENVRRFVAGKPLINVVDKQKGY